ncbi:hypothetical protein [Actinomadura sp. WMMA1423]|uniref:hypothetical protein n=1 Tax=Actinomadura sp. WMMA1423 TaxID=2591108 RepID=UPI0011465435|nr:hypothetical protein [Actinomadura sp. WMMA1423]
MGYRQTPDRVIASRLTGTATRLAGWNPPTGAARARAVAELRDIATVHPPARRGAVHQPAPVLRADLLAEVAGLLLGTAPTDHPEANRAAAELLVEAGASRGLLDHWIGVGRARAARAEYALVDPAPEHRWP